MPSACAEAEIEYVEAHDVSMNKSWRHSPRPVTIHVRENWFPFEYRDSDSLFEPQPESKMLFDSLKTEWQSETWHVSSIRQTISHPAYLKVIGMGREALPFIFEDLRVERSLWFWALEAITREGVSPSGQSMDDLRNAWLEWAQEHGY